MDKKSSVINDMPARRVVVIVGRPNVGKSAIFNRLMRRRMAIVHSESGVTRDRLMSEAEWNGERFELIDTGGLVEMDGGRPRDAIEAGISDQVDAALNDSCVAMFVVDSQDGLHPLDEGVADLLRRKGRSVVIAANKADGGEEDVSEFERFGFSVFPVSALHDKGFGPLMDHVMAVLPPASDVSTKVPLKVAIVGRQNVGKSSYVNRLLRSDRVIVSNVPGTTRDSIDVPFTIGKGVGSRHYLLMDTAGLRRSGKVDSAVEKFSHMRTERSVRTADVVVLVLDALCGPTAQDKKIGAMVLEHWKGCVLLVNKWDAVEGATQREYGPALMRVMPFLGHCPIVFASAKTGYNMRRTIEVIDWVASQVQVTIPTGVLNRTVVNACRKVEPPSVKGKRLKIFYAAQTGNRPVRIRIFVNDPSRVVVSYREYLIKTLRQKFGLEGAPVFLEFKSRR